MVLAADGEIWKRTDGTGYWGSSVEPPGWWLPFDGEYAKADDAPVRPLVLLARNGKPIVSAQDREARELLLAEGGQFDDDHTHDAHRLAKVAELLGLHVVWETCDGCPGHLVPARIEAR